MAACTVHDAHHTPPRPPHHARHAFAQDLETLLWAICRLEHRADKLVAEMAKEVGGSVVRSRNGGGVAHPVLVLEVCFRVVSERTTLGGESRRI